MQTEKTFLISGEAARRLGISKDYVRQLGDQGKLKVIRASGGVRLFCPQEIDALVRERSLRKAEGQTR